MLKPAPQKAVDALLDAVRLFGMGYSWGGFESLVIPFDCAAYRTATTWAPGGPTLRLHIGLENVEISRPIWHGDLRRSTRRSSDVPSALPDEYGLNSHHDRHRWQAKKALNCGRSGLA